MRFIKGDEFAQGFHQNGERAGVAFTLRRYLADACEALFNLVHLPFGGTPEFGNQLPARFARALAASARHAAGLVRAVAQDQAGHRRSSDKARVG